MYVFVCVCACICLYVCDKRVLEYFKLIQFQVAYRIKYVLCVYDCVRVCVCVCVRGKWLHIYVYSLGSEGVN